MNLLLRIIFSVTIIFSIFSCKKDDPLTPPDNVQADTLVWKTITGALVLPSGVSGTGIRVNSGRSDSAVVGGQYVAEVLQDDFGIQIVRNAAGNEILMGYTYPGQTDFAINAKSTITAIMMMLPDVQWLNKQGKLSFLDDIHNSPKLAPAVSQLESDLAGGGLLYDTSHVEFMNRISELYGEAAGQKISSGPESVKFSRVNKQVMIENANGKPFSHCIGVYKDGQPFMPSFTLDRYKFFASSYSELITRAEGSIPDEVSGKIISLGGDGKYEFRIRTGRPFSGVDGFESQQAFVENGTNFVMDNLAPTLKVLNLNNKCLGAIRSSAINSFQNIKGVVLQNNQGSWQLFKKMVLATAASSAEIAKSAIDCQKTAAPLPNTYQALFAASIKKFYNWFDNVALVLNNGNLMIQYFYYPAAQDTCLMVSGNTVTPCSDCQDGGSYQINIVSGDNQTGKANKKLSQPLKVKILGANGEVIPELTAEFSVLSGGGFISGSGLSGVTGIGQAEWTLGTKSAGNQVVKVRFKNCKDEYISGNGLQFTATVEECIASWKTTNLNVTSFRNGELIPHVEDSTQWSMLTTPAWCYYKNKTTNGAIYGVLYNWYAVNDPRGLAPQGWHIPSDEEWSDFTICIGGLGNGMGGKMKLTGTDLWLSPNTGATNSSGFSGLPGGYRSSDGAFLGEKSVGLWWSSNQSNETTAVSRSLYSSFELVGRDLYDSKKRGYSVRCVKD